MSRTVHLAGSVVIVGDRVLQRCAGCGIVLVDTKNSIVIGGNGSVDISSTPIWEPNSLVGVEEVAGRTEWFAVEETFFEEEGETIGKLPPDTCVFLEDYYDNDRSAQRQEVPPPDQAVPPPSFPPSSN